MSTSVKVGWARQQYGRDRYDIQIGMDDLPFILAEHGVDEAGYKRMPFSVRKRALRLEAEIDAKEVYYNHEAAEARAGGATGPTQAMTTLKAEIIRQQGQRESLLEPYKAAQPEPAPA